MYYRYPRKGRRFRPRWPKSWEEPLYRAIVAPLLELDLAVTPKPANMPERVTLSFRKAGREHARRKAKEDPR